MDNVSVAKNVDPVAIIDYIVYRRSDIQKSYAFRSLFKIRMLKTEQSLLVTVVERKTNKAVNL